MGTKGVPFGYLEFSRAIGREPCPIMCARTAAGGGGGGRPVPGRARARARDSGPGSGSLPGLVLFEPGLTGMGYAEHTRSAIWIRTARPTAVCKPSRQLGGWTVAAVEPNRCNGSDRTVATVGWVRTEIPLQSAINSAPFSQIKTHQIQLSLSTF